MRFAKPRISDEDEVEGILYPGRVDECQDIVLADSGIEMNLGTLVQIQLYIAKEKILTVAR